MLLAFGVGSTIFRNWPAKVLASAKPRPGNFRKTVDPTPTATAKPGVVTRVMAAFTQHIFVCCNTREPGNQRGCCDPTRSEALRNQFKIELKKRGLNGRIRANKAG